MVLYLAGRCAITQDHSDHNRTVGLRFEARHVPSLPVSVELFLPPLFSLSSLTFLFACPTKERSMPGLKLPRSSGSCLREFESTPHLLALVSLT